MPKYLRRTIKHFIAELMNPPIINV